MNSYFDEKLAFFNTNETFSYDFRIYMLKKLKHTISKYEQDILDALKEDLNKPSFEAYSSEIGIVYETINKTIKNLSKLMKPEKVKTPIFIKPGSSYIYKVPKGVVLIISPWNYPFQLVFNPLVASISAGNCAVVKPSNKSKATSKIVNKIIEETFDRNFISVVNGPGSEVVDHLVESHDFDHIFFTGSVAVGRHINKLAAEKLIPTTLELGGKSPCLVFPDAEIKDSAKKIVWGKFFNAGQTCVAPDYLLVHKDIKEDLISEMIIYMDEFYKSDYENNLSTIIDEKNFNRLVSLINENEIIHGGSYNKDKLLITPTLLYPESINTNIMKEEIFGPLLPIVEFESMDEAFNIINLNPNPLALYLFTQNKGIEYEVISSVQFGGGCINNVLNHFVNDNLPFGGVRQSGLGRYHSVDSFNTFSNSKGIYKSGFFEANIKYPPYTEKKLSLLKRFMK